MKPGADAGLEQRIIRTAVDWSAAGRRLDYQLAARFTYRSLEEWRERIVSGEITLNGAVVEPERILALHDIIEYRPGDLPEPEADLNYRVLYEDDALLVVEKPGNLCMHPSGPFFRHTLWHLLSSRYGKVHFINRLDRETSGLLTAARTPEAAARLFRTERTAVKRYLAIVHGRFSELVRAEGFLIADSGSAVRKKRRFVAGGRPPAGAAAVESAVTLLEPVKCGGGFSLVAATLGTGRMHQIRATLYSLGFPVVGDKLYGVDETFFLKIRSNALTEADRARLILPRQALHADELEFTHPESGERLSFRAELPSDLAAFAELIR